MMTSIATTHALPTKRALRTVVVVCNQPDERVLNTIADACEYDVIVVESTARAYSHIRRVAPQLVVVCLEVDDPDGFRVLSMLKLDGATCAIPVVTCVVRREPGGLAGPVDFTDDDTSVQTAAVPVH